MTTNKKDISERLKTLNYTNPIENEVSTNYLFNIATRIIHKADKKLIDDVDSVIEHIDLGEAFIRLEILESIYKVENILIQNQLKIILNLYYDKFINLHLSEDYISNIETGDKYKDIYESLASMNRLED